MTEELGERRPTADFENPQGYTGSMLHMGVAEQGKLYALAGNHKLALQYYKHAMHMVVQNGDPEVFFRHHLECVIESLEHLGSLNEVLSYCDQAIALYAKHTLDDPMRVRDLAHIHQRRGVTLLRMGRQEEAGQALAEALRLVGTVRQTLPLADRLHRWVRSNLKVDDRRLFDELKRASYFTVRPDNVEPDRAVKLPPGLLPNT